MAPTRIVEDSEHRTVMYTAEATPVRRARALIDRLLAPEVPTTLSQTKWRDTDFISISYPGEMYSIWVMWRMPERQFQCWYVNIGKPLKRTAEGFETTDLALDVVIRPDFTWYWKDEDEFAKLIEMGYYSEEFAAEIRNVGLAAIEQLESRSTPFDESWPDWSPPSNWNVPEFRPSWVEGLE